MKVLVVGERGETRFLAGLLEVAGRQTDHFADRAQALAALGENGERYDYAIVEGEPAAGTPELLRRLRRGNERVPVVFLRPAPAAGEVRLIGAFERSPRGLKPLSCLLTEAAPTVTEGNCVRDLGRIVYEYQGVCRRPGE